MGKKLLVSLALEGKFANDNLQAFYDDDDMPTAMARELVTQKEVGERGDLLWKQLQQQTAKMVHPVDVPQPGAAQEIALPVLAPSSLPPYPTPPLTLAEFAFPVKRIASRPMLPPDENQLSLVS